MQLLSGRGQGESSGKAALELMLFNLNAAPLDTPKCGRETFNLVALEALPTGLGLACPSIGQSFEGMLEQEAANNPRLRGSDQPSASSWELGPTQVPDCKWQATPLSSSRPRQTENRKEAETAREGTITL